MMKNVLLLSAAVFASNLLLANDPNKNEDSQKSSYIPVLVNSENLICDFEKLDSLCASLFYKDIWFEDDSLVQYHINMPHHLIPSFLEQEIRAMLELIPSAIPLDYNHAVKQYIDRFTTSRRSFIAKALGLSNQYFPLYEEVLDRYNMPDEMKYLSVIESGLNTKARSPMGATGLWQFMYRTGKSYGLEANSFIDDRCDPVLATDAAARFLTDLYKIYGDWQLCMAAYNAGPGNVNKAIARSGGKRNYWEIRPFLPRETQNYVPQFIAVAFVMHYHEKFQILPLKPKDEIFQTDTIIIKEKLSLDFVSEQLGINKDLLALINPSLKSNIIPKSENGIVFHLPSEYVAQFIEKEEIFKNDTTVQHIEAKVELAPAYTVYKVKSGDTLGAIANRYKVKVSQIKAWNSLKSDFLNIGQKLVLYI
jgi:membrane-bound lytic murein transglycosylase D